MQRQTPRKILVVGQGGREHAICRALAMPAAGEPAPQLFVAPGNPGTASLASTVDLPVNDSAALAKWARDAGIDLVIPGPEAALVAGVADAMAGVGIACCGPTAAAARLEESKVFTRTLAARLNLPSPRFVIVSDAAALRETLSTWPGAMPVIKVDGLASGKGVFLPETAAECEQIGLSLLTGALGAAGTHLVLEERLQGPEASLFYACSGTDAVALPHARDHKRLLDGERGPNTGGMGAISPNPGVSQALEQQVRQTMVLPTLRALTANGTPFCGFLFVGLMLTTDGPKLLEYNVRLGDPEAQAILPRLQPGEFLRLCTATAHGTLQDFILKIDARPTCVIVLAAPGYPDAPQVHEPMQVEAGVDMADGWLIHAGTRSHDGVLQTAGGRVAAVVARADDAAEARRRAYSGVSHIAFRGMQWRRDIGA